MAATRNDALLAWMETHGHSSNSLAETVNAAICDLTGHPGGLDGSSVRDWKAGRVKWPKAVTRTALESVTGLAATELVLQQVLCREVAALQPRHPRRRTP